MKFKMLIRLEDGSEHEETVLHCACYAGAVFEATNTVRFWNLHMRATDKRKELIRVYQVGEEQSSEQDAEKTNGGKSSCNDIDSNDIRNRVVSSSGAEERKDIIQSSGVTKSKSIVPPTQRKLF